MVSCHFTPAHFYTAAVYAHMRNLVDTVSMSTAFLASISHYFKYAAHNRAGHDLSWRRWQQHPQWWHPAAS
mgnify:CR=1 FL=1